MKISIFGATGALGRECVAQALEAGYDITVLARTPSKLPSEWRVDLRVVEGDGLVASDVEKALEGVEAVLFAIGIDANSPEDLCTTSTRHIFAAMPSLGVRRFVCCSGGSTPVPEDQTSIGSKFVEFFASHFMGLRHRDKIHQMELMNQHPEIEWLCLRPLQMRRGAKRGRYRVGFDRYSGLSKIHFADCAAAMLDMLSDDTWLHKAPIIQY